MKKIIAFMLTSIMIFASVFCLAGCDEKSLEVFKEEYEGKFCRLQEAYDTGLITKSDLKKIADIHNNVLYHKAPAYYYEKFFGDEPNPKYYKEFPESLKGEIKRAYAGYLNENAKDPIDTEEDVMIYEYLGAFSGCPAIMLGSQNHLPYCAFSKETVADIVINYTSTGDYIWIYY